MATSGRNALDVTIDQQKKIGMELLPRGFLAKGWKDAMEEGGDRKKIRTKYDTPSKDTMAVGDGTTEKERVQDSTWQK